MTRFLKSKSVFQNQTDLPFHSSEIRGLCLMKCSSETLQNLPYFWNTKTHVVFFLFHFVLLYFFPNECPGLCQDRPGHPLLKIQSCLRWKKSIWVFLLQKYGKFWSISQDNFIKHNPLISEVCCLKILMQPPMHTNICHCTIFPLLVHCVDTYLKKKKIFAN